MKRFYNFLSLLLLSLVGVTTAVAQDYKRGELYTELADFEGQTVVLYAPGTSDDHPAGYMNGKNTLSTQITDSCFYVFEAIDGKTVDGEQLYRLKQVSSGLYVKDADGQEEDAFELTASEAEAFEMTVMPFKQISAGEMCSRNSASDEKQDLSEVGFVLCRGEKAEEPFSDTTNEGYIYIGGVDVPFISPYSDTNVWRVYAYEATKGLEKLEAYMEMFCPQGVEPYPAGSQPGYYKQELVDAAKALFDKANLEINAEEPSMSDEEIDVLCAQLKEAFEALADARIPLSNGYFFIRNVSNRFLYDGQQGGKHFLYTKAASSYAIPETLTPDDVKMIWKVTPAEGENMYRIENCYTNLVISGNEASCSGTDNGMGFLLEADGSIMVTADGQKEIPSFIFSTTASTKNGHKQFHGKFNDNPVMAWNAKDSENNCMKFFAVSEEAMNAVLEAAKQQAKNEALSVVYQKALTSVMEGTSYMWDGEKDEDFNHEGALIESTGDESTSHFFSNAKEPNEGAYEDLLDGDFSTFFHSAWNTGAFTASLDKFHYLGVELPEPVSGPLTIKMAKRVQSSGNANDYPVKFAVYGTNDEVDKTNPDAAEWTLEGIAPVDWCVAVTQPIEKDNCVGFATVNLSVPYKYVRFGAIETELNPGNAGRGYFALGEAQLWKGGVLDEVNSTISMVSKPTMDRLNAALETAKAELAKGAATDATMAELQAAYEQFVKEFPVPALLTEAAAAAQAVADNANTNGMIGDELAMYPQDAYDALVAAIEAANNYDTNGKTAAEINAEVEKVNAAVEAFKASLKLPEAGKYYEWIGLGTNYRDGSEANGWNSLRAKVYSPNNALNTSLYFTRPKGAADKLPEEELTDTVAGSDNLKYLWYIEKAEAGKLVIRNVGTGMYVGKNEGAVAQSKTPVEISVLATRPGKFVLECGEGIHFNAHGGGKVAAWADANDQNAFWGFKEIDATALSNATSLYWPVSAGKYQILTLPVSVDMSFEGTMYDVMGVTADNKLALVENLDGAPAGTPFVFLPDEVIGNPAYGAIFNIVFEDDVTLADGGHLTYATEPVATACLTGTLCEPDTVPAGYGYFYNGKPSATDNTVIGVNSGWIGVRGATMPVADEAMASVTIELGKVVIDEITSAQVVTLPAAVSVYNVNGQMVRKNVKTANALKGLPAGIYVVGGQKFIVK